jgi:DNA recombination protein RmuC
MDSLLLPIVAVLTALSVGVLLGFAWAHIRASRRVEELRLELEGARVRLESVTRQDSDRIALLEQSESRLRAAFESMAGETMRTNSEVFLRLAKESLGKDQQVAQSTLKERETAIAQLVEPLKAAIERTDVQAQALERERRDAYSTLRTQIETLASGQTQLQRETRNLVTALRRPEVRGRWGELTLRRLVELAGMAEHCDFTEQVHVAGEDGAIRPDLVVHLPDARDIVVDVKTPLDAFLEALDAESEEARSTALKRHAQQVETRVRQLAAKNYWMQFEHSPEFAVLFLPGDQFLGTALAERPELLDNALKQSVIIATPSTLIALLKVVAHGWRQSAVAQNAATIRELGQELYRRLGSFNGHLGRIGQRLSAAVEAYNSAVGSLERQVMPQARRFTDLGVTADAPLPELEPVAQLVRNPSGPAPVDTPAPAEKPLTSARPMQTATEKPPANARPTLVDKSMPPGDRSASRTLPLSFDGPQTTQSDGVGAVRGSSDGRNA